MTHHKTVIGIASCLLISVAGAKDYTGYVAEANGNLTLLDISTGTHQLIGNSGGTFAGLAFASNNTLLGSTTSTSNSVLNTVDRTNGQAAVIGNIGFGMTTITNLSNGYLYGVDRANELVSVNPTTGKGTVVGATGLPNTTTLSSWNNSLASDGQELYYTFSQNNGISSLYTLSLSTGAATLVGSTGSHTILGSVFASTTKSDGALFGFSDNGAIYKINTTTGLASLYGNSGITDYFGGVGITAAVPEPSTIALATMGLFFVGLVKIKAKRLTSSKK